MTNPCTQCQPPALCPTCIAALPADINDNQRGAYLAALWDKHRIRHGAGKWSPVLGRFVEPEESEAHR